MMNFEYRTDQRWGHYSRLMGVQASSREAMIQPIMFQLKSWSRGSFQRPPILYSVFTLLLLLPLLRHGLVAQTLKTQPGSQQDSAGLVRAKRLMRNLDKDENGKFEKSENPAAWRRYRNLDSNKDGVLTIGELEKYRDAYLETGGPRSLNVVYKQVGQQQLHLDLYYPVNQQKSIRNVPVVIYTHGGGWAAGSKQGAAKGSFKSVFLKLLDQGFAIASVNYRLCKKGSGVTMRDCVIDSKDAVRYLAKHSQSLKLDRESFFVMGDSAGGQIAQMLLLTSPRSLTGDPDLASANYQIKAGISWYGPCDFEKMELFNHDDRADFRDRFANRILGSDTSNKLDRYREVSPINYLKKDSPPLLMIQGDQDTTIPVKHAYYMKQKADSIQAPVEIMIIKNAGHNWRKVDAETRPSRQAIIERTVQFFADHLSE